MPQEQRSIEERFLTKSEAMAKGEDEPAVAFQKRLEALKRDSRAKLKVAPLPSHACITSRVTCSLGT